MAIMKAHEKGHSFYCYGPTGRHEAGPSHKCPESAIFTWFDANAGVNIWLCADHLVEYVKAQTVYISTTNPEEVICRECGDSIAAGRAVCGSCASHDSCIPEDEGHYNGDCDHDDCESSVNECSECSEYATTHLCEDHFRALAREFVEDYPEPQEALAAQEVTKDEIQYEDMTIKWSA